MSDTDARGKVQNTLPVFSRGFGPKNRQRIFASSLPSAEDFLIDNGNTPRRLSLVTYPGRNPQQPMQGSAKLPSVRSRSLPSHHRWYSAIISPYTCAHHPWYLNFSPAVRPSSGLHTPSVHNHRLDWPFDCLNPPSLHRYEVHIHGGMPPRDRNDCQLPIHPRAQQ